MYKRNLEGWIKHWDFILLDTLCLQLAFILGYCYRFGFDRFVYSNTHYQNIGLFLVFFSVSIAVIFNTMKDVLKRSIAQEVQRTLEQSFLVFSAFTIFLFSTKDSDTVSRIMLYVTMGIYPILSFIFRLLYKHFLIRHKLFGKPRAMLLITYDRNSAADLIRSINKRPQESISLTGLVMTNDLIRGDVKGVPVVSEIDSAADYICRKWIDEVYIALPEYSPIIIELLDHCAEMGVTVHQKLLTSTETQCKQFIEMIANEPVLTSSINIAKPWQLMVKRIFDLICGFLLSIASGIVLLVISPVIKKASSGPVLLRQERIGRNGERFKMYSIRTMYMDAEERLNQWKKSHPDTKRISIEEDPRFIGNREGKTGIGVAIRRLGLEEFPMAFNVLRGQMSFVGTRAPSVEEWEHYQYHHRARLATKPGITGLWQASGRSRTMTFEEATALDTYYIANWSLRLDAKILFKSIFLWNKNDSSRPNKDQ